MSKYLLVIFLSVTSISCTTTAVKESKEVLSQSDTPELMMVSSPANNLPPWLTPTINELRAMPGSPGQIIQCTYQNDTVYYVPSAAFHKRSVLYRADGSILCHPDGGITGKDSRCPDFHSTKTNVKVVWSHSQKP